jgi:hypothetical protein
LFDFPLNGEASDQIFRREGKRERERERGRERKKSSVCFVANRELSLRKKPLSLSQR